MTQGTQPNGVYADAVWFDSNGTAHWKDFVNNGTIQNNAGSFTIAVPDDITGGKLYFLVQSIDPTDTADVITNAIGTQAQINWANAASLDFGFDSFEFTLNNSPDDVGNLTSVVGYGLPIGVSVAANGTTASVGYGISGSTLTGDLADININVTNTYTAGALINLFREAVSPATSVTPNEGVANPPFNTSDWNSFVAGVENYASDIVLTGLFVGTEDAAGTFHNSGYFAYQLTYEAGNFFLDPISGSQIHGTIEISPTQLADSIYQTTGTADIINPDGSTFLAGMNVGYNNQWGAVLRDLFIGFEAGYYGVSGAPINPQGSSTVDLDQNYNQSPFYAYGQNTASATPAPVFYDQYSTVFFDDFQLVRVELLGRADEPVRDRRPADLALRLGRGRLERRPDDLRARRHAEPRHIARLHAAADLRLSRPAQRGHYDVPGTIVAANQVVMNFAEATSTSPGISLDKNATITLNIMTSDAGGVPVWTSLVLNGASAGADGLWQNWTITNTGGTYSATASPAGQPAGSLLLVGLPTPVDVAGTTDVSWYQIVVGDKTFNLYAETNGSGFINPAYTGSPDPGALSIDGGAIITPPGGTFVSQPTIPNFTVVFNTKANIAVDPSLLSLNTGTTAINALVQPDAPVAGTIGNGGTFTALAGQTAPSTNTITTTDGTIAFAWTGENDPATTGVTNWVTAYTNKVEGLDVRPDRRPGQRVDVHRNGHRESGRRLADRQRRSRPTARTT